MSPEKGDTIVWTLNEKLHFESPEGNHNSGGQLLYYGNMLLGSVFEAGDVSGFPSVDTIEKDSGIWKTSDGREFIPLMNRYLQTEQTIQNQKIWVLF